MPVSTAIDLYLAKSVGELNKSAEIPNKTVVPKVYVKTAEKLFTDANRCSLSGDEEKAYVLYMRYFNIITLIKKTAEYKKQKDYYDSLIGKKNLLRAIEKAETLSKSLTDRYELLEAETASKKLEALNEEREKVKQEKLEEEAKAKEAKEVKASDTSNDKEANGTEKSLQSEGALSASGLYQLMQSTPDQLIIMDARSVSEFTDSHLRHKSVINVPVDIITPGITVPRIETSLPPESRELWEKRAHVDYIVLMDWNSTIDTVGPGKTLQTLKDALFKFDSKTIIKSEPLILEGGYDEWCLYYPAITTHPVRDRPLYDTPLSNIPSLDFDYPDLDAAFVQTPSPVANKPTNGQAPATAINQSESLPSLHPAQPKPRPFIPDRTTKPTLNSQTSLDRISNDLRESVSQSLYPNAFPAPSADKMAEGSVMQKPKSNLVAEQERELAALQSLQIRKQQELETFQKEKERMALEHKARLEQLKTRQAEIERLEQMKHQQEKDVADLMRMKRRLEEEVRTEKRNEEQELREKAEEEHKRTAELERMKEEEEMRISRLKAVEESRSQRKLKEEGEKLRQENLRKEEEAASIADAEKKRLLLEAVETKRKKEEEQQKAEKEKRELAKKNEEAIAEAQQKESARRREEERKRREEIRLQQEKEREELKKKEEERKRKLEEQKLAEEREKREHERLRLEKLEKDRKEKERRDKEKAEEAKKMAEERLRRIAERETKTKPNTTFSTMLPVGWERRLDKNTNRYYYLNHNDGTSQWDPPQTSATSSPAHAKVYKTKLRDEDLGSGRGVGLVRSHSSPNIAQLVEDEGTPTPNFNRGQKPAFKPLVSQQPSNRAANQRAAARMRDLCPVYGSVGPGLTGLRNLGNTCYMNSTLQCLNNCFPLVSYFLNDNYLEDINRESKFSYNGEVVDDFAIVMKALWQKQYKYISSKDFKNVCATYNSMFAGTGQQDSQEFLAFLLDGLHEGLNRIKTRPKIAEIDTDNMSDKVAAEKSWVRHKLHNESIIVELFQGVLKSTVTCLSCGKKSTRFDVFQYLTLPLPTSLSGCTLQDCLRGFLREEKLSGSSQWYCPRCKVNRDAVKKLDIWKLPHILIIHLNRFIYEGMWREKKNQYVDFPVMSLDLDNIVTGPKRGKPYSLYAVSNHYGTMEGGHYTAYAKNPLSGDWHKFDDHEVYSMNRNDVKTAAAYFLFYTCLQ